LFDNVPAYTERFSTEVDPISASEKTSARNANTKIWFVSTRAVKHLDYLKRTFYRLYYENEVFEQAIREQESTVCSSVDVRFVKSALNDVI